jgi:hypothetical protein
MENRLLNQFNEVITSQWPSQQITENYEPLKHKDLFELAYHTCNSVSTRCISLQLSQDENKGGTQAILYSQNKTFTYIHGLDSHLQITLYYNEEGAAEKLTTNIQPQLKKRKENYFQKDNKFKVDLLKTILVERKLDECANLVMSKDINRKIYFAIGDARESAAVVPMFMEAEGASLVQLALNKWMSASQRLPMEQTFPENQVPGLLKNLMQIKKWLLNLVSTNLDT